MRDRVERHRRSTAARFSSLTAKASKLAPAIRKEVMGHRVSPRPRDVQIKARCSERRQIDFLVATPRLFHDISVGPKAYAIQVAR